MAPLTHSLCRTVTQGACCAAVLATLLLAPAAHAVVTTTVTTIDDFSDGPLVLSLTPPSNGGTHSGGNYAVASIPGGERSIAFSAYYAPGTLTVDTTDHALKFDNGSFALLYLGYGTFFTTDGAGMQNGGSHHMAIDMSNDVALRINVTRNTGGFTLNAMVDTQRVYNPDVYLGTSSVYGIVVAANQTGNIDIPLASFTGSVDWSDVDGLQLTFNPSYVGSSFTIGSITLVPVPEPASAALLALGGLALLRRRSARPGRSA